MSERPYSFSRQLAPLARRGFGGRALELLRGDLPAEYDRWVRLGALLALGGFLATWLLPLRANPSDYLVAPDLYAVLGCAAAYALSRRERPRAAAWLLMFVVWAEIHLSLATTTVGIRSASILALITSVVGAALILGERVALLAASAASLSAPAAIALGGSLGTSPGISKGDWPFVVGLVVCLHIVGVMQFLVLRALGDLVRRVRHHAERAEELMRDAPDAILALSPEGRIESLNPAAERLVVATGQQVLGRQLSDVGFRNAEGGELDEAVLGDGAPVEMQLHDGRVRVEALARLHTREDAREGLLIVLRDVTQRRAVEERARELEMELAHAQKLDAMGQVAGRVAHDFNNMLTAVAGYTSLLSRHGDEQVRDIADDLLDVQERAVALTRQLLSFSRKDSFRLTDIDLAALVRRCSGLARGIAGEGVSLDVQAEEPCPIRADAQQLEQAILNLVANARDAMPEGGHVKLRCRVMDDEVELSISDTGTGMDAATRERIFEPFFTTKSREHGTGLGLSTVHAAVRGARGCIDVESSPGHGARFVLRFPRAAAVAGERSSGTATQSSHA